MAKIAKATHAEPKAWIVSSKDRGRKSIKKGKVFLKDQESFEIELFNPLQDSILADIKLNGKSISKSGLVLRPGQRFYLDCFIDDKKKFVFNTYEIDSNDEESVKATEKNGLLEVFFYKEEVITLDNWKNKFDRIIVEKWYPYYYPYNTYPYYPTQPTIWYGTDNVTLGSSGTFNISNSSSNTVTTNAMYSSTTNASYTSSIDLSNLNIGGNLNDTMMNVNSMETGRVEKGEKSSQKFTEIDMDFEKNYISSTIIQILPESRKPVDTKEIFNKKNGEIKVKSKSSQIIELIKKLADLHESGILTDEEFSEKKSELLSKI
jgi:hypothetical protein